MTAVAITLQLTKTIPDDPPMVVPTITNLPSFGTMAPDDVGIHNYYSNKVATDKQSTIEDRSKIEEEVNVDQLIEIQ